MYFADFYTNSATTGEPINACGDRGIYILDGRNALRTMRDDAADWARKHGFIGYKICVGKSFTQARDLTAYISVG